MRIYFRNNQLTNTGFLPFLQEKHEVSDRHGAGYDIIFNMDTFGYQDAELMKDMHPETKLINWVWDYYKFAHEGKHDWEWKSYSEFLKKSDLIIVPSHGQQLRLKELLGLDSVVVRTGHDMLNIRDEDVKDGGFVLDHMRWYPEENEKWIVTACETQYIPVLHTEHRQSKEDFARTVASCRFLACGYREASTGGLTILEGLWLGKPVLLSDSPYQGGKDYAGEFANYFKYDDFEDCKKKVKEMYENPPKINIEEVRKYIKENFSYEVMSANLIREFEKVLSGNQTTEKGES